MVEREVLSYKSSLQVAIGKSCELSIGTFETQQSELRGGGKDTGPLDMSPQSASSKHE